MSILYTIAPLADVNTVDSHAGFYVWLFIAFVIAYTERFSQESLTIAGIFTAIAAVVSFNTGTIEHYANEKVVGEFVRFVPEGFTERSGKHDITRHLMYAEYKVDNYFVPVLIEQGSPTPKFVYLYKNDTK